MRNPAKDTLVAPPPQPVIRHASEEAHHTLIAAMRGNWEQATIYAAQEQEAADQAAKEVAKLTVQLAEAERGERERSANAQRGRDVANSWASHLAAAGEPLRIGQAPYGEGGPELPPNQERALAAYNDAVNEQRAAENGTRQ